MRTQRQKNTMCMKAEIGVINLQAKECLGKRAITARREAWNRFSFRILRRNQPCQYLDFRLLASITFRE